MKEQIISKIMAAIIAGILSTTICFSQGKLIGGPCEGCEAVFEFGNRNITSIDTLPEFESEGTQIKITGTVHQKDEETPAEGVILYVYQTNDEGVYPKKGDETGWARRHGYIRGWIKTDQQGRYTFYTQKPHFYGNEPAHVHVTILEPDGSYYYINDFTFEGDKNLTQKKRNDKSPRGGTNGILRLKKEDGIIVGYRNIILGKNIANQ